MAKRFTVPKATRIARDAEIDSLSTEWLIEWPSGPNRWGKAYRAIERHNPRTIELLTAARRQPVRLVQRNRLIDAVNAAIYKARQDELKSEGQAEPVTEKTFIGTIDCTPTWASLVPAMIAMLQDGSPQAQQTAKEELARMANLADRHVASQKQDKANA